jgi:hypothetical protein
VRLAGYFKSENDYEHEELMDTLLVVKHRKVDENIMRIPSVLGRDILNKYSLTYERKSDLAVITNQG